jgi:hypothetical protein
VIRADLPDSRHWHFVSAVNNLDYPVIRGLILVFATMLMIAIILVDVAYALDRSADPSAQGRDNGTSWRRSTGTRLLKLTARSGRLSGGHGIIFAKKKPLGAICGCCAPVPDNRRLLSGDDQQDHLYRGL